MTQFTAIVGLLAGLISIVSVLILVVWRARGYVDRLNTTDSELSQAITELSKTVKMMHRENRARFRRLEGKLK